MQNITVTADPTLMPMIIVVLIILGGIFLLAGGAHLLAPLLHHFGLVLLGLIAVGLLIFVVRGLSTPRAAHVAVIQSDGVTTVGGGPDESSVAWAGLLKLGLIAALVIAGIVALAHSGLFAHPHVLGVGGAILAVVIGMGLLWFIAVPTRLEQRAKFSSPAVPLSPSRGSEIVLEPKPPRHQKQIGAEQPKPTPSEAVAEDAIADDSKPSEQSQPSENIDANLPDWVNEPPHWKEINGRTFVIVVRSGLVTDPNLLEEQLDMKMVARTNQYIDEQVLRRPGASDVAGFDADYLREHCVRQRYPTDGKSAGARELFVQMEFDRPFRDEISRRYNQFISEQRLQQTGGIAAAAFAVLGGLYLFLRTTGSKKASEHQPI